MLHKGFLLLAVLISLVLIIEKKNKRVVKVIKKHKHHVSRTLNPSSDSKDKPAPAITENSEKIEKNESTGASQDPAPAPVETKMAETQVTKQLITPTIPQYLNSEIKATRTPVHFPDLDSLNSSERVSTFMQMVAYYKSDLDAIYKNRTVFDHDPNDDKVTQLMYDAQELIQSARTFDNQDYPSEYKSDVRLFVKEVKGLQREGNLKFQEYQKQQQSNQSVNNRSTN